jgi:g-D-glutamyl-meso-diaminopimelate peptidase
MYTYNNLLSDVSNARRSGAKIGHIGSTVLGRMIPYVHVGCTKGPQIIVQGAIHAREHITAQLVSMLMYTTKPTNGGVYFIPMVNIDGVCLAQFGLDSVRDRCLRNFLTTVNDCTTDFSKWKANINAVDLNVNFPARWGTGLQNVFRPAPANYVGRSAGSENETHALMAFTQKIKPAVTISYHCTGQEIYWDFFQDVEDRARDYSLAQRISQATGYKLVSGTLGSAGGYKDWCIQHLKIPAFTIEILPEAKNYPVSYDLLDEEYERNKDVITTVLQQYSLAR